MEIFESLEKFNIVESHFKPKDHSDTLPWCEKYRPPTLSDFTSHQFIHDCLKKLIDKDCIPHLLFYGPPGTGKTSAILALASQIYTPQQRKFMVLELNASDDRGISTVRNEIMNFASSKSLFDNKPKLIILDEADSMTHDAQNALRRIIEKYARNVRFCLLCNYMAGIIPAIISRCMRFRFFPLKCSDMCERLEYVARSENVPFESEGINSIVRSSGGDMRKALNTLQATFMSQGLVTIDSVRNTTGYPSTSDISQLVNKLFNDDISSCYQYVTSMTVLQGVSLAEIIKELLLETRKLDLPSKILAQLAKNLSDIEYNASIGSNIKIHIAALVSAFYYTRDEIQNKC